MGEMEGVETAFEDGNLSAVTRLGSTVRRASGFWTPAVHSVLRYLEEQGFDYAPRVLGYDDKGREILTYIEGQTAPASLQGYRSDSVLIEVARILRYYHDVIAAFKPPADATWQAQIGAPKGGDVICHNDVAPWNTVFRGEHAVAFLDWDYAAPGQRIWDIAHALWRYVPLTTPGNSSGLLDEQVRRITTFCKAYGFAEYRSLLGTIERRQQALYDTVAQQARVGVPVFVKLWNEGHAGFVVNDLNYLRRHRTEMEALLAKAF